MKLDEIADIKQGITLSRIRIDKHMEVEDRIVYSFEKETTIKTPRNIEEIGQDIPLIKEDMILFNIVSYNAKKATIEDLGKIIPSNYVAITLKTKGVDPDYLAWYIDQSEIFKLELNRIIQGTTVLSLPINEFRQMDLKLPSLDFQKKIGSINRLNRRKNKLFLEKEELIYKSLVTINEEEIINE